MCKTCGNSSTLRFQALLSLCAILISGAETSPVPFQQAVPNAPTAESRPIELVPLLRNCFNKGTILWARSASKMMGVLSLSTKAAVKWTGSLPILAAGCWAVSVKYSLIKDSRCWQDSRRQWRQMQGVSINLLTLQVILLYIIFFYKPSNLTGYLY